jgi:hypothetical protein
MFGSTNNPPANFSQLRIEYSTAAKDEIDNNFEGDYISVEDVVRSNLKNLDELPLGTTMSFLFKYAEEYYLQATVDSEKVTICNVLNPDQFDDFAVRYNLGLMLANETVH